MGNAILGNAKKAKNNEFYTQYSDIENEINAYLEFNPDVFRGKTILLPCDDPEWSNFTKYFAQRFETLGLKKLISTSYGVALLFQEHGKVKFLGGVFKSRIASYGIRKSRTVVVPIVAPNVHRRSQIEEALEQFLFHHNKVQQSPLGPIVR